MKCSVTDNIALKPKDINILKRNNIEVRAYSGLPKNNKELIDRISESEIAVFDAVTKIDRQVIKACPKLRLLIAASTGYNNVDTKFARKRNIDVCNCPGIFSQSVVEYTFSMMMMVARNFASPIYNAKTGGWSWDDFNGNELNGKTLGVIGAGNIGSRLIKIAQGFGMKVVVNTLHPDRERADNIGINNFCSLNELLSQSDYISINVKSNKTSKNLINSKNMVSLKPGVCIINTSTNNEIDLKAVYKFLKIGIIGSIVLDSMKLKPDEWQNQPDHIVKLFNLPNVITTPDIAWCTNEGLQRLAETARNNIISWVNKKPVNIVN